jgi:hypothetical protein
MEGGWRRINSSELVARSLKQCVLNKIPLSRSRIGLVVDDWPWTYFDSLPALVSKTWSRWPSPASLYLSLNSVGQPCIVWYSVACPKGNPTHVISGNKVHDFNTTKIIVLEAQVSSLWERTQS